MEYQEFVKRSATLIALVLLVLFIILALGRVASLLQIAFACWVLSVVLEVPISRLRSLGVRRGIAIILAFIGVIVGIFLLARLILPGLVTQIGNLISELPAAMEAVIGSYGDLRASSPVFTDLLPPFTTTDYQDLVDTAFSGVFQDAGAAIDLQNVAASAVPLILGVGNFVGNIAVNFVLVIFITMYLILDPMVYYRGLIALLPASAEQRGIEILNEIRRNIVAWLGALAVSVSATGLLVLAVLGIFLQVPNALALGVLAGLGNIIPYIGYYAALIPIAIFALASAGPVTMLIAIVAYIVIGEIENKLITPTVIKNELNIPAGLILLFQLIAGALMGFLGILLAVPILAIIITLIRELYVYDGLGKAGRVTHIVENAQGQLLLQPPETVPDEPPPADDTENSASPDETPEI